MRLRSGKIVSTFPTKLDKKLEAMLQDFKALFSGDLQHAKELLDIIRHATSGDARFAIRDKIEEIYDVNNPVEINPLMGAAGSIAWLLVYNPQYHDIIETRIRNFDLNTPILGSIEENSMEL